MFDPPPRFSPASNPVYRLHATLPVVSARDERESVSERSRASRGSFDFVARGRIGRGSGNGIGAGRYRDRLSFDEIRNQHELDGDAVADRDLQFPRKTYVALFGRRYGIGAGNKPWNVVCAYLIRND